MEPENGLGVCVYRYFQNAHFFIKFIMRHFKCLNWTTLHFNKIHSNHDKSIEIVYAHHHDKKKERIRKIWVNDATLHCVESSVGGKVFCGCTEKFLLRIIIYI